METFDYHSSTKRHHHLISYTLWLHMIPITYPHKSFHSHFQFFGGAFFYWTLGMTFLKCYSATENRYKNAIKFFYFHSIILTKTCLTEEISFRERKSLEAIIFKGFHANTIHAFVITTSRLYFCKCCIK